MLKLLEQLTELDKQRIHNFICTWGTIEEEFIGVDEYLKYWAKNNTKLYHMLGNQLSVSVPFSYEKDVDEIQKCLADSLYEHPFWQVFNYYVKEIMPAPKRPDGTDNWTEKWCCIDTFRSWHWIAQNLFPMNYKALNRKTNGTLQLQKNMKYIKAMNKIYDADPEGFAQALENRMKREDFAKKFIEKPSLDAWKQDFINKHSEALNDKKINSTLTISIHPLDFLTMSDNGQDWESCMSWKNDGCYHQGTVEMMNSNCVFCCYLHNPDNPWNFSNKAFDEKKGKDWEWNNKKYRVLVYATKDIIVTGKSYPYHNDEISQKIVTEVYKLITKNMDWHYSFGPEKYKDMKWINGAKSMDRAKRFARRHETVKHNLIIDTNAMYNDFVRDSERNYWCYRNKVEHTKVINASGPALCLCCSNNITEYDEDNDYDYFERFKRPDRVVCSDCVPRLKCSYCDNIAVGKRLIMTSSTTGKAKHYCRHCIKHCFSKCHCCGKWYIKADDHRKRGAVRLSSHVPLGTKIEMYHWNDCYSDYEFIEKYSEMPSTGMYIPMCPECLKSGEEDGTIEKVIIEGYWGAKFEYFFFADRYDFNEAKFKEWRAAVETVPQGNETFIDF